MKWLAAGRDADVYAVGDGRVLRRYRRGGDVAREAALMSYVARHGYPVPAVHHAEGPDLVLDRVDGPTMAQALETGSLAVDDGARALADLHDELHALPGRPGTAPGSRVVHLDLHPDNVLLGPHGPVVIDWRNATDGEPDVDVAMTAVILAQVALGALEGREPSEPARVLLAGFLASVAGRPLRVLDDVLAARAADPNMSGAEQDRLGEAGDLVRALAKTS